MPSNALSFRRDILGRPKYCKPPPPLPVVPPPPPPAWDVPDEIPYHGEATYDWEEGPHTEIWDYVCTSTGNHDYEGHGESIDGSWSQTVININLDSPGNFDLAVEYDTMAWPGLVAREANRPLNEEQPHTYTFPPWTEEPEGGILEANIQM